MHIACGYLKLQSLMAEEAVVEFEIALGKLDQMTIENEPIEILAVFGSIIAYDFLGFQEKCKHAIGTLLILFEEC